jgi:ABC-type uncharacterized transport system auxiliary subunit
MSRVFLRLLVSFFLLFLLSGCAFKSAELKTYTLNPAFRFGSLSQSPYRNSTVKVAYPNNIKGKSSDSILFSYSRLEEGSYQNSSWTTSSSQLLTGTIIRALEHGKVFKSVIDYTSQAMTDYLLESEIYDFYHKLRKGSSVSVVTIRFDLIDTRNNMLVKSKKFSYIIPTPTVDAAGYVRATNQAIERLSADLVRWLAKP